MSPNIIRFPIALFLLISLPIVFTGCKKDSEGEGNEEEIITTFDLIFTPASGGNSQTFSYRDADGPGGNDPERDIVTLAANTTYDLEIRLLNETVTPAEDITAEVREEGEAHRFYFEALNGFNFTPQITDLDANNVPVGLESTVTTPDITKGRLRVVLRHYPGNPPDKQTPDPIDSPKSSTDLDVTFEVEIE
jgi:hypothetical protein